MMTTSDSRKSGCRRTMPGVIAWLGVIAWVVSLCVSSVVLAGGFQIRLRNDLTIGSFTSYRVRIHGVRTTPTPRYTEKLAYEQTGRLTLVVLESARPKAARRAWMMELDEPRVTSLTRDDQPVEDLPDPKLAGLPPKGVQLRISGITSSRADAIALGGSLVQRAGMLLALDFAHWPDGLIATGDTWQTATQRDELKGLWTHRYVKTEGARSQRLAVGEFEFEGQLADRYANVATVKRVEGTWKWRVAKRSLHASSADVVLSYGKSKKFRELALHVELELEKREMLPRKRMAVAREEILELSRLARAFREIGGTDAEENLHRFIESHQVSLWLPVARDLLERAQFDVRTFGELDAGEIVDVLTKLITRWQLAAMQDRLEPLQPIRATFRKLMKTNREVLRKLVAIDNPNTRAMAIFCTAFGDMPADLTRVVSACKDEEARVRAWAAYGLAERRATDVEPAVLEALLSDADDKVRQRACMAIQSCVRADSPHRTRFFKRLIERVRLDKVDGVRLLAAAALGKLATKADLPAIIDAEHEQDVPPVRRQLESTIRRLGGKPKEWVDE